MKSRGDKQMEMGCSIKFLKICRKSANTECA